MPEELATTDEENVKVFLIHFGKVLNDMKPTDDSVINEIQLQDTLIEFDTPPEWLEFTIAITELTNDKAPGLNNVTPTAFKAMTQGKFLHLLKFIIELWEDWLDFT